MMLVLLYLQKTTLRVVFVSSYHWSMQGEEAKRELERIWRYISTNDSEEASCIGCGAFESGETVTAVVCYFGRRFQCCWFSSLSFSTFTTCVNSSSIGTAIVSVVSLDVRNINRDTNVIFSLLMNSPQTRRLALFALLLEFLRLSLPPVNDETRSNLLCHRPVGLADGIS